MLGPLAHIPPHLLEETMVSSRALRTPCSALTDHRNGWVEVQPVSQEFHVTERIFCYFPPVVLLHIKSSTWIEEVDM